MGKGTAPREADIPSALLPLGELETEDSEEWLLWQVVITAAAASR